MYSKRLLHFGWIFTLIFILGVFVFGSQLEGYNPVSQTVSEIGERGSPFYMQWLVFSIFNNTLFVLFAIGIISFAKRNNLSITPGILVLAYGLSQFATDIFASPHPLHNVFGLSMLIGYFSPLIFALRWKSQLGSIFRWISIVSFILVLVGIFLNLSPVFAPSLYPLEYYGLVQRFLLFTFAGYCAFVSISSIKSGDLSQKAV